MRQLLRSGVVPPFAGRAVQVGGSKGKGTTCAFLDALCRSAGLVPGVYLSPHTDTLLERIRIGDRLVAVEELERLLPRLLDAPGIERSPTFFEAMTVAAAALFAEHRVDLAVYEVGLGGRHDATTALPVDAAIVTMIELEHTDVLGDTHAAIAAEKAPVIRPAGRGFTGARNEALAVIRAHAHAVGARLSVLGEDLVLCDVVWRAAGCRARLRLPDGRELPLFLPDAREFELPALALAAAAFAELLPRAPLVLDPAPRPVLPCRFEPVPVPDGGAVVLDGAHTEDSIAAVARELARRWPGRRAAVLFGTATGKRWREALPALFPVADRFLVAEVQGTASEDPAAIVHWLRQRGANAELVIDARQGLERLCAFPGPRLVVGSFYLAGQVRRLLLGQGAAGLLS